jgi:hypothetical protein
MQVTFELDPPLPLQKQLKVSPNFKVTADGEVDFDFGIKLPFGEFEDKSPMEIIEKLLPGPVSTSACWMGLTRPQRVMIE